MFKDKREGQQCLGEQQYIATDEISTVLFLAERLSPSFLAVRVVDKRTGEPVENDMVSVMGRGLPALGTPNIGGWLNFSKNNQVNGTYWVVVMKGLRMTVEPVVYKGEPLQTTISLR